MVPISKVVLKCPEDYVSTTSVLTVCKDRFKNSTATTMEPASGVGTAMFIYGGD